MPESVPESVPCLTITSDVSGFVMFLFVRNKRLYGGQSPKAQYITSAVPLGNSNQKLSIDGLGQGTYYVVVYKRTPILRSTTYFLAIASRKDPYRHQ